MSLKNKHGKFYGLTILIIVICLISSVKINAQLVLTLEQALETANENSPNIKRALLNLERSQQYLNAQRAALKSNFSLSLNPISYNQSRTFNDLISDWNTNETLNTGGTFTVSQPIKLTDGTISLNNSFGWQKSYSEYSDRETKTFSNN